MNEIENELIERFLNGLLSEKEEQVFRQRLQAEPELRERVNFERQLQQTLNEDGWGFAENQDHPEVATYQEAFKSPEAQKIKETIEEASRQYSKKSIKSAKGKGMRLWMLSSAAILAFVLSFLFLKPDNALPEQLYVRYLQETDLPSLATRGQDAEASEMLRAQGLFDNQEYEEAVAIFQQLLSQGNAPAALYINLALSQAALEEYDNALSTLDLLINSNLLDAQKGPWFKSLVHLKAGSTDKAKAGLQKIIDNQLYNASLAESLLSELD